MSNTTELVTRRRLLRSLVGLGALASTGSLLAACAPSAEQPSAKSSGQTAATPAGQVATTPVGQGMSGQPIKLELWTFVNTHARWWRAMAEEYKKTTPGFELDVKEMATADMHDKLQVALSTGVGAPDIADINQNRYGGFLKGDIKLAELTPRLQTGGYLDKIVESRLALYSWKGKIYGVEHALTPVVLYYRADIFEDEGIKPEQIETWDDFIRVGKQLSSGERKMTFLAQVFHELLLRQRGGDYFDADGNVTADSDLSISLQQWLLDLRDVHGIAEESPVGANHAQATNNPALWGAFKEGRFLTVPGADWYAGFLRDNVPELAGKWRAMPLPAWEKGGRRTSCYGGTGASITLPSKNQEAAWKFLEFTMLSPDANVKRYLETKLWPPLKTAWNDPRLHTPDPYFAGQDLGELFSTLGSQVPAQHQNPYRAEFNSLLLDKHSRDIWDKKVAPAEGLKQLSDEIRKRMREGA